MKTISTLLLAVLVFAAVSVLATLPNLVSEITMMLEMAAVFGVLLLVVPRFKSFAQTPEQMKTLIVVLVCLRSITITGSVTFFQYYYHANRRYHELLHEQSGPTDSADPPQAIE
jgi:hypothetical protein